MWYVIWYMYVVYNSLSKMFGFDVKRMNFIRLFIFTSCAQCIMWCDNNCMYLCNNNSMKNDWQQIAYIKEKQYRALIQKHVFVIHTNSKAISIKFLILDYPYFECFIKLPVDCICGSGQVIM